MEYFWTHREFIPDGIGYGQFSVKHFFLLVLTIIFVSIINRIYRKSSQDRRILIRRSIAVVMLITEINKLTALGLGGVDVTRYLPLEICSFALYTIICDSIKPDNKFCPQMLVTLFLPAAIMALIFPTTIYLPLFNYFTIHQFFFHGLIIAYIISRFSNGEIEINYPGVWKSVLKICVIAFFVFLIDTFLNRNFMFLKNSDNNFLLNIIQDVTGGGIFYTLGLVGFVMVVIHIFFFIFKPLEILFRKKKTVDTV